MKQTSLLRNPFFYLSIILFVAFVFQVAQVAGAWTFQQPPAGCTPGSDGCSSAQPVDISGFGQTKTGDLTVTGKFNVLGGAIVGPDIDNAVLIRNDYRRIDFINEGLTAGILFEDGKLKANHDTRAPGGGVWFDIGSGTGDSYWTQTFRDNISYGGTVNVRTITAQERGAFSELWTNDLEVRNGMSVGSVEANEIFVQDVQAGDITIGASGERPSFWQYTRSAVRTSPRVAAAGDTSVAMDTSSVGGQVVGRIVIAVHDRDLDREGFVRIFEEFTLGLEDREELEDVFNVWSQLSGINSHPRVQESHGIQCGLAGSLITSDNPLSGECVGSTLSKPYTNEAEAPPLTLHDFTLLPNKNRLALINTDAGNIASQAFLDAAKDVTGGVGGASRGVDLDYGDGLVGIIESETDIDPNTIDGYYWGPDVERSVLATMGGDVGFLGIRGFLGFGGADGYDVQIYIYEFYPAYYQLSRRTVTGVGGDGNLTVGGRFDVSGVANFGARVNINGGVLNVERNVGATHNIRGLLSTDRITIYDEDQSGNDNYLKVPEMQFSRITIGDSRSRGLRLETSGGGFLQGYMITGMYRVITGGEDAGSCVFWGGVAQTGETCSCWSPATTRILGNDRYCTYP